MTNQGLEAVLWTDTKVATIDAVSRWIGANAVDMALEQI